MDAGRCTRPRRTALHKSDKKEGSGTTDKSNEEDGRRMLYSSDEKGRGGVRAPDRRVEGGRARGRTRLRRRPCRGTDATEEARQRKFAGRAAMQASLK